MEKSSCSPQTLSDIMLVMATAAAWIVGRLAQDDNIYRAVFLYAFICIILHQQDVPAIAWTASICSLAILVMIVSTWKKHPRRRTTSSSMEVIS